MKAKIGGGKKKFEPFTLTITVETVDDARDLWHRLNVAWSVVLKHSDSGCIKPEYNSSTGQVW
jgi:hypothetical protein